MKYRGPVVLLLLYAIIAAGQVVAEEACAPVEAPSPSSLWEIMSSPEVDACINRNVDKKKTELEIDDPSVDASLRKANTIGAWNMLLMQLEDLRARGTSAALEEVVGRVHGRASSAWESVSTTDMGVAAKPQAYQSAWQIDFDGNLGPLLDQGNEDKVIDPKIELEVYLTKACADEGESAQTLPGTRSS